MDCSGTKKLRRSPETAESIKGGRAYNMLLKAEEIYLKFNEESIEINIPKKLLLPLLQQVNRL